MKSRRRPDTAPGSADQLGVDMDKDMPSTEEWRTVAGHPHYEVSSLGRLRSLKAMNFKSGGEPRLLKPFTDKLGYVRTQLDGVKVSLHRAIAEAWHGPCPDGKEVDHINSVRDDNRPENLRYLTRQENMARMVPQTITECLNGHSMTGDNVYIRPSSGRRECRGCSRLRAARPPVGGRTCFGESCGRIATHSLRTDHPLCEKHYQRIRRTAKRRLLQVAREDVA